MGTLCFVSFALMSELTFKLLVTHQKQVCLFMHCYFQLTISMFIVIIRFKFHEIKRRNFFMSVLFVQTINSTKI